MSLTFESYNLNATGKVNVILGKNGAGKSFLLRACNGALRNQGAVKYITPERGGRLTREANVEANVQNTDWLFNSRNQNRSDQFRHISVSEFSRLETLVLRKIEQETSIRKDLTYKFDKVLDEINLLLDNVKLERRVGSGFELKERNDGSYRQPDALSSGEAELISLGIEILSYAYDCENTQYKDTQNWLLLDEPDVHLHPDLQFKLMRLLVRACENRPFNVLIATHSTAIVSALFNLTSLQVAFMRPRETALNFETAGNAFKSIMPIFGAHPLSNIFNERPILLLEGEDDERIWQQACRSSQGSINVWPCVAGDIQSLNDFEVKAGLILGAVYDGGRGYSLRDRDDSEYLINDLGPIIRCRLACRAAENLILSDDVLARLNCDWPAMQIALENWLLTNIGHQQHKDVIAFREGNWDRKGASVKSLRNLLMTLAGSQKPWEVAVGQAIANLKKEPCHGEMSLTAFLGTKIVQALELQP